MRNLRGRQMMRAPVMATAAAEDTGHEQLEDKARAAANDIMRAAKLADPQLALCACKRARAVLEATPEYVLLTRLPWSEAVAREDEPAGILMRAACLQCAHRSGVVRRRNGQDVVRCGSCGVYQYCAPRRAASR